MKTFCIKDIESADRADIFKNLMLAISLSSISPISKESLQSYLNLNFGDYGEWVQFDALFQLTEKDIAGVEKYAPDFFKIFAPINLQQENLYSKLYSNIFTSVMETKDYTNIFDIENHRCAEQAYEYLELSIDLFDNIGYAKLSNFCNLCHIINAFQYPYLLNRIYSNKTPKYEAEMKLLKMYANLKKSLLI